MLPPAVTVAGPLLVSERSAEAVTLVSTLSSLFVGSGSAVADEMSALLVRLPGWLGAVTTMVIVVVDPADHNGRSQVTEALPLFEQVQPPLLGVTETKRDTSGQVVRDRDQRSVRRSVVRDVEVVGDGARRPSRSPVRSC